jgi:hypothetical protein
VTRDRSLGQFEHTVAVTEGGVEIFTLSPKGLDRPRFVAEEAADPSAKSFARHGITGILSCGGDGGCVPMSGNEKLATRNPKYRPGSTKSPALLRPPRACASVAAPAAMR